MDQSAFDRIARTLAGAATRREGLQAAIAAIGAIAGSAAATAARRDTRNTRNTRDRRDRRDPAAEGPCKSTKRPDNICAKDSECCTGICNTKTGKKNKDRQGRCRCIRRGGPCSATRNCCSRAGQQMTCTQGRCGEVEPGPGPNPEPTCSPDVCASGCAHTTVQGAIDAAAAGDTIIIGPGTWDEDLLVSKDIVLTCCPNEVATLRNKTANRRTIVMDETADPLPALTIRHPIITKSDAAGQDGGGIAGKGYLTLEGTTIIENCRCTANSCSGGGVHIGDGNSPDPSTFLMTGSAIVRNCEANEGGGVFMDQYLPSATFNGDAKVQDNTAIGDGGGVYVYYDVPATFDGNFQITGNSAGSSGTDEGGGLFFYGYGSNTSLTIGAGVTITSNSAGVGGGVYGDGSDGSITVAAGATISGNTPDQCAGTVSC
ncbi:MAG: hypothetical protein ACKOWF_15135 [Chloroflexota bacterium]